MTIVIVFAVLAIVVFVISAPLRAALKPEDPGAGNVAELEAAREAKLSEIREAEFDHRTGKLSDDDYVLEIVQVFICVMLIILILMHSGKDSGLSGAFGVGTGAGPFGGGSLVERNLNRWTVGFALAFVINTIILIKIS